MTKEPIKLSIDKEVLDKAKKQIPNMSNFFENCLKAYLGDIHSVFYTTEAQEMLDQIKNAQTSLYLLIERNNIEENVEKAKRDEILLTWRRIYAEYRDTRATNPDHLKTASEKLGVTEPVLKNIILMSYAFRNEIDVTDWETVFKEYGDDL